MKHPAMFVMLLIFTSTLVACGRSTDEAALPTPVAVYTRSADGADAAAQATTAETDGSDAADAAESVGAESEGAETDTAAAQAEDVAAQDDVSPEEPAENAPEADTTETDTTESDTTESDTTEADTVTEETAAATSDETSSAAADTEPTSSEAATETAAEPTATLAPTVAPTATPTPTPESVANDAETMAETASDTAGAQTDTTAEPQSTDGEFAGVPTEVAALIPDADIARGEQLVLQNACIGCHNLDPNIPMAGPTWYNMAGTAATRVEGQTAAAYLYNSIIHPNDYIVDGYAAGVMLQTYEDTLTAQDLADIVGYLLTLRGE